MRIRGLLLGVALAGLPVFAVRALDAPRPGPEWQVARNDSDLVIYFRDDVKADARELRATTEMSAPPKRIFDVVTDFDHYPKFMPYTQETRILYWTAVNVLIQYTVLAPPFIQVRDAVNQVTLTPGTEENGGVFKSEWAARPDLAPPRNGAIRIRLNTGSWRIEPLNGGQRSRIIYSILTSPGGAVPRWMIDQSNNIAVPALFDAVRKRVAGR